MGAPRKIYRGPNTPQTHEKPRFFLNIFCHFAKNCLRRFDSDAARGCRPPHPPRLTLTCWRAVARARRRSEKASAPVRRWGGFRVQNSQLDRAAPPPPNPHPTPAPSSSPETGAASGGATAAWWIVGARRQGRAWRITDASAGSRFPLPPPLCFLPPAPCPLPRATQADGSLLPESLAPLTVRHDV